MKPYKRVPEQLIVDARHEHDVFERVYFEKTSIWSSTFVGCTWVNCKFYGTAFANNCRFTDCRFVGCRFWGQHTHFGGPSLFERCRFEACQFKDVTFWEASLVECVLAGRMENVAFFGVDGPIEWLTTFKAVDLSAMSLKLVEFRLGFDLTSTKLPDGFENHGGA